MLITYTDWNDLATTLGQYYQQKNVYFTPETYQNTNPMEYLTSGQGILQFFGPKPITIMIIGLPYGWKKDGSGNWVDSWPPDGFTDALNQHTQTYPQWSNYQTLVWLDFIIVGKIMDANPDSMFETMMNALDGHLTALGTQLTQVGINYMGKLMTKPEYNFFTPFIEQFLATQTDPDPRSV
jgi:hypothetical protein